MSIHHGRGSEAKRMQFYQTIQLSQLQDQELMIPRNFVERYWKDVSNPISLKLPNGSICKIFWLKLGDDVWLLDWKRFARSLRCGDLLVFQYNGGSDFHVTIFDDSKLEIDYSSMIFNDEKEEAKESDHDVIEITDDESDNDTKQSIKKEKMNSNDRATTSATPQVKKNIHKRKQKVSVTDPSFELKLTHTHAHGYALMIPCQFSRRYLKDFEGSAWIRRVSEDRIWKIEVKYDRERDYSLVTSGWKQFTTKYNLQIGDVCKFVMNRFEPFTFTITITRAGEE